MKYSIIVPTYNRIDEVEEFLESLTTQSFKDFEVILVDGSPENSLKEVDSIFKNHQFECPYRRIHRPQLGISDSRNLGASVAEGEYLIFFDSDVIIPSNYFEELEAALVIHKYDLFGGPDAAHDSFTVTQKAINYCMTSILTTGGIRGRKISVGKFRPRGFNLGISKKLFEAVKGFDSSLKVGEDIDLSARALTKGCKSGLIEKAFVYHKRRVSLRKFFNQVFRFGIARVYLARQYSNEMKVTHLFPLVFTIFLLTGPLFLMGSQIQQLVWLFPVSVYLAMNMLLASIQNRSLIVGFSVLPTLLVQFTAYALGFAKNWIYIYLFRVEGGVFDTKKAKLKQGPESPL